MPLRPLQAVPMFSPPSIPQAKKNRDFNFEQGCLRFSWDETRVQGRWSRVCGNQHSRTCVSGTLIRGPRMGGWIRPIPSWLIFALLGHPDFLSRGPKPFKRSIMVHGTSGLKIGAPQKRENQPRRIQPPILGPLSSEKCKVLILLRVWSFSSHARCILLADDFGRFLWNSVEITQNRWRTKCTMHAI